MGSRLLGRVGYSSGWVMDFTQPYLFSFMDHLCQYLDYGPLFSSSNFNVFSTHYQALCYIVAFC
ncbi:hypothetical protein Hanom_Chr10g00907261 [Helianthus anomalus]